MFDIPTARFHRSAPVCTPGAVLALAALILLGAPADPARAQILPAGPWEWTVTPFVWGTGLSGRIAAAPGLAPVDVDAGPGEIPDDPDFGAYLGFAAQNGRFGFSGDLQHIRMSGTAPTPGPAFSGAAIDVENAILTLMGEYQLNSRADTRIWAMGGLRYWSVSADLALGAAGSPAQSASGSDSWLDPVIGARGRRDISDRMFLTGWAYVGGFGAGSEEMYDIFGGLGFAFSEAVAGVAGYRWMSVDRVNGSFVYDTSQGGMLAGVKFNF